MSIEYDALKKANEEAKKQYDKDVDAALKEKDPDKRKEAAEAAAKKLKEALDAAMKAYLDAMAKAKSNLSEFVNKIVESKKKEDIDNKKLNNMVALVAEAQSLEVYKKEDDCKKKDPGSCTSSISKDGANFICEQATCKCKCHAYVNLGGQLLRAHGFIHGANFGSCPVAVNEKFGSGTIVCKCVEG